MKIEIKNAKITHTFLGFEDHDCFTFILELDYGGSVQGAKRESAPREGWI